MISMSYSLAAQSPLCAAAWLQRQPQFSWTEAVVPRESLFRRYARKTGIERACLEVVGYGARLRPDKRCRSRPDDKGGGPVGQLRATPARRGTYLEAKRPQLCIHHIRNSGICAWPQGAGAVAADSFVVSAYHPDRSSMEF